MIALANVAVEATREAVEANATNWHLRFTGLQSDVTTWAEKNLNDEARARLVDLVEDR